jgi:uncharacterized membrane protein YoaK (UPF0700 family)/anti-anti-sigma regulatory factor
MFAIRPNPVPFQSRLAISLAWVAGYVNTSAVLTCGVVTSHVTGHAGTLGKDLALRGWSDAAFMGVLIGAFLIGAMVSGLALETGRQRGWRSIYVLPATIELVLLAVFAIGVRLHDTSATEVGGTLWWMTTVAAMAMGVQNATITRISSGVVRTTHLTGVVTDLGLETARLTLATRGQGKHRPPDDVGDRGPRLQRLALLGSILGGFVVGSACGAWVYIEVPRWSMLAPLVLLAWIIVADLRTPTCEIEEASDAESAVKPGPGSGVAVFRAAARGGDARSETRPDRSTGLPPLTRLPELTGLLDRAGTARRTVVVDLSGVRVAGPLAADAIRRLHRAARSSGHRVIIAGIDAGERSAINALSGADLLTDANSAPTFAEALKLADAGPTAR